MKFSLYHLNKVPVKSMKPYETLQIFKPSVEDLSFIRPFNMSKLKFLHLNLSQLEATVAQRA